MASTDIPAFNEHYKRRLGTHPSAVNFKHGFSSTRLGRIFNGMRARCYNPKSDSYGDYGAKGITICEGWLRNRSAFYAWAIANGYDDRLFLDRKESDLGYSPQNCRWVTQKENQNNKWFHRKLEYGGETLALNVWAMRTGIDPKLVAARLKDGWPVAEVLGFSRHERVGPGKSMVRLRT